MSRQLLRVLGRTTHTARVVGFARLLAFCRDAADSLLAHIEYPPLKVTVDGLRLSGYLRHRSFLEEISKGTYEIFTRDLIKETLKPGITVIDAGAHIGLYSLLAAKYLQGNGQILAFEADFYNFHAMNYNIARNNAINVISINKAISDSVTKAVFYKSLGTIGSSLVKRIDIGGYEEIQVDTTSLDHEIENMNIDFLLIKLDIEGAELKALYGMYNTLQSAKEITLITEINPKALAQAFITPNDMIETLQKLKFEIWFIDDIGKQLIPVKGTDVMRKGNFYCVRKN